MNYSAKEFIVFCIVALTLLASGAVWAADYNPNAYRSRNAYIDGKGGMEYRNGTIMQRGVPSSSMRGNTLYGPTGNIIGRVEDYKIKDPQGNVKGYIDSEGRLRDLDYNLRANTGADAAGQAMAADILLRQQ